MGKGFGELAKVHGLVTYKLSPFEQAAFAGFFTKGVPNTIRRCAENFWRVVPPFLLSYIIYTTTERKHAKMMRKNPDDFACDE